MAWRQGCMGSMNMQCELNLYSTFLKKVLFQQLRINPAPSMLQTKQLTFIYFSLTLIISILAFVVLSYRDTKPWIVTSVLSRERPKNGCHQA